MNKDTIESSLQYTGKKIVKQHEQAIKIAEKRLSDLKTNRE